MLTQKFLTSLENWQKEGRRCVQIKIDSLGLYPNDPWIWLYDYNLDSGLHIRPGDPLPSREELLREKRQRLQKEMANL